MSAYFWPGSEYDNVYITATSMNFALHLPFFFTLPFPDVEFDHDVNDALMRFFDQCTRFVQTVGNNPSALKEVDKFRNGPEMRRVQEKIADRLRVPYNLIDDGDVI